MAKKIEPKEPTLGRILDYEEAQPDELLVDFKRRVNEQIDSIRVAIRNDDVNDPTMGYGVFGDILVKTSREIE